MPQLPSNGRFLVQGLAVRVMPLLNESLPAEQAGRLGGAGRRQSTAVWSGPSLVQSEPVGPCRLTECCLRCRRPVPIAGPVPKMGGGGWRAAPHHCATDHGTMYYCHTGWAQTSEACHGAAPARRGLLSSPTAGREGRGSETGPVTVMCLSLYCSRLVFMKGADGKS